MLSYLTWLIILFIPAIGITNIERYSTTEIIYFWPWLVYIDISTIGEFGTDQIVYFSFPWSLILFIPSFYALQSAYKIQSDSENRLTHAGYVILAELIQILIIFVTYQSQSPVVSEQTTVYFIPQILVILILGYYAIQWYRRDIVDALEKAKKTKQNNQNNT